MNPIKTRLGKITAIVQKNFKILARSKSSAAIIVLGPLFLILLVGIAYNNTDPFHINVGVYSSRYSSVTEDVLYRLSSNAFDVTKYPLEEACIDSVKRSKANICIVFPGDLDVKTDASQDVTFHVDLSDINIVYKVLSVISTHVENESREMSRNLTDDLLSRLASTEGEADSSVPTVVQLTRQYDAIGESSSAIGGTLQEIELAPTGTDGLARLHAETNFMKQLTITTLDDSEALIAAIRKEAGSNSDVDALLKQYETGFLRYKGDLRAREGTLNASLAGVYSDVTSGDQQLEDVRAARDAANAELSEIKTTLSASLHLLNEMQISLNNIKKVSTTLEIKDAVRIVNPITTKIIPVIDRKTHFNYAFPTILALLMMITGILLGSVLMMVEKRSASFFRNSITPTIDSTFILATAITALLIMAVQLGIFLIISSLLFDAPFWSSLLILPLLLTIVSFLFVIIGIYLGSTFTLEETTILAGISAASIMLLFSSTILPIENMSWMLKKLAGLNPFVVSETIIKEALFYDLGVAELLPKLALLLSYAAIIFIASLASYRRAREMTVRKGGTYSFSGIADRFLSLRTRAAIQSKLHLAPQAVPALATAAHTVRDTVHHAVSAASSPKQRAAAGAVAPLAGKQHALQHEVLPGNLVHGSFEEALLEDVFDRPVRKEPQRGSPLTASLSRSSTSEVSSSSVSSTSSGNGFNFLLPSDKNKPLVPGEMHAPMFPSFQAPSLHSFGKETSKTSSAPASQRRMKQQKTPSGMMPPEELAEMKRLEEEISRLEAHAKNAPSVSLPNVRLIDARLRGLRERVGRG